MHCKSRLRHASRLLPLSARSAALAPDRRCAAAPPPQSCPIRASPLLLTVVAATRRQDTAPNCGQHASHEGSVAQGQHAAPDTTCVRELSSILSSTCACTHPELAVCGCMARRTQQQRQGAGQEQCRQRAAAQRCTLKCAWSCHSACFFLCIQSVSVQSGAIAG